MFSKSRARTLGCLFALGALVATLATACDPAPTITNVQSNPSTTTAYIYWETNVASSSQVFYGPTTSYGTAAPIDTNGTTTHLYLLTGLTPGTVYHYKVQSKTTTSDVGESGDYTFTTKNPIDSCTLYAASESCWAANTGPYNVFAGGTVRWSSSQLRNNTLVDGHRPTDQLQVQSGTVLITEGGTQANPKVYENIKYTGCVGVRADHVLFRNVYFVIQSGASNNCGVVGGNPVCGDCGNSTFDTGKNLLDVRFQDSELDFNEHTGNAAGFQGGLIGSGIHLENVNAHGGFIVIGYISNSSVHNSYIHDVTDGDLTCAPGCGNLHSDTIFAQHTSNFSVTRSFIWHDHSGSAQSSGGCLCDGGQNGAAPSNVFFEDVFLNGGTGHGITFDSNNGQCVVSSGGPVTWHRLNIMGNDTLCNPTEKANYVTYGSYVQTFNSYGVGTGMTNSRCGAVVYVNSAGSQVGTECA